MGYATVKHVPRARDYATAKKVHDGIVPIRGKDVRPLGARRDYHQYSVKQNEQGDIEFICYRTPVVTFHQDDTITIRNGGWTSVSTHQFIQEVLGIQANGYKGKTALTIKGNKYLMDSSDDSAFKIKRVDGNWHILSERPPETSYRMNRKAANNVRARYKPFADYLRGFSKVRAEHITPQHGEPYQAVRFSHEELQAAFGVSTMFEGQVLWRGAYNLLNKRSKNYNESSEEMMSLITSDDHEKWNKAALWFFGHEHDMHISFEPTRRDQYYLTRRVNQGMQTFDEFILKQHAHEVIEKVQVEDGKLPNMKYADWV